MELTVYLAGMARRCEVCGQYYIFEYYPKGPVAAEPCDHIQKDDENEKGLEQDA